jgi:uncharacterized OsmC-like protein
VETISTLNGLDLGSVKGRVEAFRTQPDALQRLSRRQSRVRWLGGLKNEATVRHHSFVVGGLSALTGQDEAPGALDSVLGALGACLATGFVLYATQRGVAIRDMEITLDGELEHMETFCGLTSEGRPGYRIITARLSVEAEADPVTLREIWNEAVVTSPVANSLARTVTIVPELAITE